MFSILQNFVRDSRILRKRTVVKDVMNILEEYIFISVDGTKLQSLELAHRSVARFLQRNG